MISICCLIDLKASYQFLRRGQVKPLDFVLGETTTIKDKDHLVQVIGNLVLSNVQTGSAPYRVTSDLLLSFDINEARKTSRQQGGDIKGITDDIVERERVVSLKKLVESSNDPKYPVFILLVNVIVEYILSPPPLTLASVIQGKITE